MSNGALQRGDFKLIVPRERPNHSRSALASYVVAGPWAHAALRDIGAMFVTYGWSQLAD